LTKLVWVDLDGTGVTDVSPLASLTTLRLLYLTGTGVTDVRSLPALKHLEIRRLNQEAAPTLPPAIDAAGDETGAPTTSAAAPFRITRLDVANWRGFDRQT